MSQQKTPAVPHWYKNTYFWIAAILIVVGAIGLVRGDSSIRDPGQTVEHGLWWLYFLAAIVMLLNGFVSHRQTMQQYQEDKEARS
ncbi:MAG TPA: hypothetical protein VG944_05175 [Fimbriimonas sp.]|nr:hypothetical protein [Fimbriimonas sp.]